VKTRCKFGQFKQIETQGKIHKINICRPAFWRARLVKTLFFQEIFTTSVGDLKLKFEFRNSLKKCPSWKIFCPVQVNTLSKTLYGSLSVAATGYNLFIASSTSRADRYLSFDQTY